MKPTGLRTLTLCVVAAIVAISVSAGARADGMAARTVVIDAGHGGKDPGTRSRNGVLEKDVNQAVASAVASLLREQGINVVMTRDKDVFVSLDNRARIADRCGADLFVSIHCDFNANKSVKGFSVIMPRSASGKASAAGQEISEDLQAGGGRRCMVRRDNRSLRVLENTRSPAVLVEVGFLSNPSEAAELNAMACQERIAVSLAEGITEYLHN